MDQNIDFIGKGMAQGTVAGMLNNGELNISKMRPWIGKDGNVYLTVYKGSGDPKDPKNLTNIQVNTNGTLRPNEWKQLDDAILPVAESRLSGIQDLIDKGLTYNLGNAMGTTVLESHTVSDALDAELTMDGLARGKNDRPEYGTTYTPIPIIHVDYEINARVLAASRSLGNPLDTTNAERAARKVAEKLEKMLFTSTTYAFGGGTIYSYLNFPYRIPKTSMISWTASGKTGELIVADVLDMKQKSITNLFYGPWMLYIPTAYEIVLDRDYDSTTPGTTVRERIMKIAGIQGIKVIDTLTSGNVLLVQMTKDVVRLIRGMGIQNVQWQSHGNFVTNYKVMTIQVPQIRADHNNKTGIVHASV